MSKRRYPSLSTCIYCGKATVVSSPQEDLPLRVAVARLSRYRRPYEGTLCRLVATLVAHVDDHLCEERQ